MKKESDAINYSTSDLIRYLASPFASITPSLRYSITPTVLPLSARVSFDMQSRGVPTPRREGAKKRCVKLPDSDLKP
jgi:hypothetical protein